VIGKSLSKRLYVSYNRGLRQTDANVLTLKYLLSTFFSLQVTASDAGNGIDLLYSSQKQDENHAK
jgi:translocation and assembly module TamB